MAKNFQGTGHRKSSIAKVNLVSGKGKITVNGRDVNINDCDIILIPGLAYNVYGYRLGRGKGFYDKALKEYQGIKIGVVCDDNIIDEHFEEAHDVKVDYLVSEKRIIKI